MIVYDLWLKEGECDCIRPVAEGEREGERERERERERESDCTRPVVGGKRVIAYSL